MAEITSSFTQYSCVPSKLLAIEYAQSIDEGRDVASLLKEIHAIAAMPDSAWHEREAKAQHYFLKLQQAQLVSRYPFHEPSTLAEIIQCTHLQSSVIKHKNSYNQAELYNRIYGGILGKCIGCLVGKPIEGWRRAKIISFLHETNNYPLTRYLFDGISTQIYNKFSLSPSWSF